MTKPKDTKHDAGELRCYGAKTRIANNPQAGDKIENRTAFKHPVRRVVDRYLSGDVQYVWDSRSDYHDRCTLAEWKSFCGKGSRVLSDSSS
jgi:hypothetical protein